jgi:hypothetical protein
MRKLISLFAGLAFFLCTQAQTNPIKHMDVYLQPTQTDTASYHSPQMLIDLADTSIITTIEISLGTTNGGTDIISKSFAYNQEGEFPDGTAYVRDGSIIRLNLGVYPPLSTCFATARLHYSNGSYSEAVSFNQ